MKIRDGYWEIRRGVQHLAKVAVVDIQASTEKLSVYCTSKRMEHRGSTLNSPTITMEITATMPDILHIRSYHHKGERQRGPRFDLAEDQKELLDIEDTGDTVRATSKDLSAKVRCEGPGDIEFFFKGKPLTSSNGLLGGHAIFNDKDSYQVEYLNLSVGENIYGLGERFTPFVKNGQVVDIWNEDGGTSSEQAYKNIPFFLSSKGYGILVADPSKVSFEVCSEVVTSVQFSVSGQCLEYYLIAGDTLKDVLKKYALLAGKPALVPPWSFGLWLSTSFVTDYDEETVLRFIDGMQQRNIPLHVFHFDCFWMRELQWVDFQWDTRKFPDPIAMLKTLHDRSLKVCVWINPYIGQKSPLFDEGMEKGYLIKKLDKSVWQWDRWQAGMALVDFTNPQAVIWYQDKLKQLLDMGVDTFKTDFGERIPTEVEYFDQSDTARMHNYYTYLYNQAVFTLLERERGKHEALVFARSATVGGQKFPVHWGGDCSATYESMAESLRAGLSLSLCGFGYWSHDIGGFEKVATADLFKRWVAFGLLSTHSRLHGNESYRVPWNYDEEACEVLRFFTELKCSMMPYLFSAACMAHECGIPMMRPMILEYPDDPVCEYIERQYFLGEQLLVAPIFNEEGIASYYLPKGRWTHLLSNKEVVGGLYRKDEYDYFSLPLFAKEGSLIPLSSEHTKPDYAYNNHVTFHLFCLDEGKKTEASVHAHDGSILATCTVAKIDSSSFEVSMVGNVGLWALCLRNIDTIDQSSCGTISSSNEGSTVVFDGVVKNCIVVIR